MFKYINNNKAEDIFLIHGWATDYTIFDRLKIDYNYILINNNNPNEIPDEIYKYCFKNNKKIINILGWSMGSFTAIDFIKKYKDKISIKNLFLLSVCKQYDKQGIQNIRKFLAKNKKLYLLNFYKKCLYNGSDFKKFQIKYFDYYLKKLTNDELFIGLDYLEKSNLDIQFLSGLKQTKIKIINSEDDEIINSGTNQYIVSSNIDIKFLKKHGHAFFLENIDFIAIFKQ